MQTPSKLLPQTHRLLYRGSLALPDSHLLLDGLSFSVKLSDTHGSPALLNNPLALTLESLRGLPLHLIGICKVKETWIDVPGDITIDIHPESALTRIYFENIFCLNPITSEDGRSDWGVRVSLTENSEFPFTRHDPDTPDLLIYAEFRAAPDSAPSSAASTSTAAPRTLHLLAARILPGPPPPPSFRMPRPDDPTPRKPPQGLAFGAKRKRDAAGVPFDLSSATGSGAAGPSKRTKTATGDAKGKGRANASAGAIDEEMRRAAAEVMLRMPKPGNGVGVSVKALGKDARVGGGRRDAGLFKVPSVPVRRSASEPDVFGSVPASVGGALDAMVASGEFEKENKTAIKRVVTKQLSKLGVKKAHPEFNDLFQTCYRGVCFALRKRMTVGPLGDDPIIEHFVDTHLQMYLLDAPS